MARAALLPDLAWRERAEAGRAPQLVSAASAACAQARSTASLAPLHATAPSVSPSRLIGSAPVAAATMPRLCTVSAWNHGAAAIRSMFAPAVRKPAAV